MKNVTRIFDIPYYQLENHPKDKALVTKYDGEWKALSTQDYIDQANRLSRGLLKLGVKPNDKIAVISTANCTEWNIVDIGVLQVGAQNVPIYPTISAEEYAYVLKHSEAKFVFVSDEEVLKKVTEAKKGTQVQEVYSFEELDGCKNWNEVLKLGDDEKLQDEVEKIKESIKPDDLATLIYTSGTTGKPKGVMLSHNNLVSNVKDSAPRVPFETGTEIALSFLPVCHVFERMLVYLYQYYSVSIHYAESIEALSENFKEVKPTFITAVPRVLEKTYDNFATRGNTLNGIKRNLFKWAIHLGSHYEPFGGNSWFFMLRLKLARKLIFSKWKDGLGGNLGFIVSGSAALAPELSRIFAAADMPVLEGYGLTETSPVIAVNTNKKEDFRLGTVGKPIDHVEVKIAKDEEILVKGPNVMLGYFKDDKKTKEAYDEDGFFKTGDTGQLDADGFLKITGRKKEMFKTSGGKYISPHRIESAMKKSKFIEQIIVVGEGQKMPAALIQPNYNYIKKWAKHRQVNLKDESPKSISKNEEVIDRIKEDVDFYNKKFGHWEQVKAFKLTPDEWSIKGGQLTPTLKIKRKEVKKIYKDLYDEIYEK